MWFVNQWYKDSRGYIVMNSSINIIEGGHDDVENINRGVNSCTKKRIRDPEKKKIRNRTYNEKIRNGKNCNQNEKWLATRRKYYDEITKPRKEQARINKEARADPKSEERDKYLIYQKQYCQKVFKQKRQELQILEIVEETK